MTKGTRTQISAGTAGDAGPTSVSWGSDQARGGDGGEPARSPPRSADIWPTTQVFRKAGCLRCQGGALFSGLFARRGIARPQGVIAAVRYAPFVRDRPDHRPEGQKRADDRFDVRGLCVALGDQRGASDGQNLADEGEGG